MVKGSTLGSKRHSRILFFNFLFGAEKHGSVSFRYVYYWTEKPTLHLRGQRSPPARDDRSFSAPRFANGNGWMLELSLPDAGEIGRDMCALQGNWAEIAPS